MQQRAMKPAPNMADHGKQTTRRRKEKALLTFTSQLLSRQSIDHHDVLPARIKGFPGHFVDLGNGTSTKVSVLAIGKAG